MSKPKKIIFFSILCLFFLLGGVVYFFMFTSDGSERLVRHVLQRYAMEENISVEQVQGTIFKGIHFKNVGLKGIKHFPQDSRMDIQDLSVQFSAFNFNGLIVAVQNARLKLPVSAPIVINGTLKNKELDFNVFANTLDVEEVLANIPTRVKLPKLDGRVSNVDMYVTGPYKRPSIRGDFFIAEISHDKATLLESPGRLALQVKEKFFRMYVVGDIDVDEGIVKANKTQINLSPSQVYLYGDREDPRLSINGSARISQVDISLSVKGPMNDPSIGLTSEPNVPKEQLLLMLATGQKWSGIGKSIDSNTVSPELAKDFVQYFAFGGSGNKLAETFGLDDLSFSYGKGKRGIGARKEIGDKLQVKYEIQREDVDLIGDTQTTQTIGGAYQFTNRISLDLEKEFKSSTDTEFDQTDVERAEIMLKYKRSF